MTPTYTLTDAETGLVLARTDDPAEVARLLEDPDLAAAFPARLALDVRATDGTTTRIAGEQLLEMAKQQDE